MADIRFNTSNGLSVGTSQTASIDNINNATFLTLSVAGASTLASTSVSSLSVTGTASFSVIPTQPTPVLNSNSTQSATTAFYFNQKSNIAPTMNGVATIGSSTLWATANHIHPSDTSRLTVINPSGTGALTLAGGTVTSNTPVVNLTQTWNSSGVSFSGISLVITNTASATNSKAFDITIGQNKFGVNVNGSVIQTLASPNLARDIVGINGSRHAREYQDLNDYNVTQGIGGATTNTENFEWGFTWNGKWDDVSSSYIKDRSNAGDHAVMFRIDKKFRNQWWFSDGTIVSSPIVWTKRVDFDLPNKSYIFDGAINSTTLTTSGVVTSGSLVLSGAISGATTIAASGVITSTVATGTAPLTVASTTLVNNLTATNTQHILGGGAGAFVYQSASNVTAFTTAGVAGQVLKSSGGTAPAWVNGTISGIALGSNLNNLTFSNVAGAAIGTTYNGGTAKTISYLTVGAAPAAGSTSVITLGTISTGIWNATTIATNKGGTGITTIGTTNQMLGVNNAATGLEYKTFVSTDNSLSFVHTAGQIDVKLVGTIPGNVNFSGDLSVGGSSPNHKFLVVAATGNTDVKGTLTIAGKVTTNDIGVQRIALNDGSAEVTLTDVNSLLAVATGANTLITVSNAYKAVEFLVKCNVASAGAFQMVKLLAICDGATSTSVVEYGNVEIGETGASYDVTATSGAMSLVATTTIANSSFTVIATAIK